MKNFYSKKVFFAFLVFFLLNNFSFSQLYFRSAATGLWNAAATWESSVNNIVWVPAATPPNNVADFTITVRSPHVVTINANTTIDEVVIDVGGFLTFTGAISVTINDGPGPDVSCNGTLTENSSGAITWIVGSSWIMGAAGSLIKTTNTSSNNWQNNYWGGISTIPSTSNWIIRKNSAANPPVTTIGAWYPNLIFENNTASIWNTVLGSTFQGAGGFPTIKGNLDIGGTGSNFVNFLNQHTNANETQVYGSLIVRAGSIYSNYGTGTEIQGDLIVNGTIQYDAADSRRLVFSGTAPQAVSGTGNLNVYNMVMNKSSDDLTLSRNVKIDFNITFNNPGGRIFSSAANLLIIEDNATATNANNTSFVHGPVRKYGDEAFTFPVGKNNDYQAIGCSAGPPAGGPFWTEAFQNSCSSNCPANGYVGPNGAWTTASTGPNGSDPNVWYVSGAECGNAPAACGSACSGTDPSLHLGSNASVLGDIGAAYLAGGLGFWFPQTNVRAQSPAINCTGYSNITLSFNYIEWGSGAVDDGSLWYFDGATWTLLFNLNKTACCGGACNGSRQGMWTTYTTILPASANNNPNVKIGFNWTNNDDNVGEDPSFAIDDIVLSVASSIEQFTAEYFYSDPQIPYGNVLLPNLATITNCEYWILTRDVGSSNRTVTLTFDANSCGYQTTPANLLVANHNTGNWYDRGNGGFTATTITTAAAQTVYGPYTLGSVTPLPVELVNFTAKYNGKTVDLNWITASEINNDFFTVERTKDGKEFSMIVKIPGAGNSTTINYYEASDDAPLNGLSYYRLMQTDFDGTNSTGKLVPIKINENDFGIAYLYPDNNLNEINIQLENITGKINAEVIDVLGRTVISQEFYSSNETSFLILHTPYLNSGIYILRIHAAGNVINKKFFY